MVLTRSFKELVLKGGASDVAFLKALLRKGMSNVGPGPKGHEGARD
jgi:hypothetical protein